MAKLGIVVSLLVIIAALGFASVSNAAGTPCHQKKFKTLLVRHACEKGGQPAAKKAMKVFMKKAHIKSCKKCHSRLSPKYTLKPGALKRFHKAGGR